MAEQANGAEQSPESRLLSEGFTRRLDYWCPPGSEQALTLDQAVAALDSGEVKPHPPEVLAWPAQPGFAQFTPEFVDEHAARIFAPSPPPPWLPELAALVAEKLKPEVRAAVKAEARKARECA